MSAPLFTAVFSVAPTKRRRFLWAAWWTAPPEAEPFRKPDASSGGARSAEEAKAEAERAAGRPLVEIASKWARAWSRTLRGEPAWPTPTAAREPGRIATAEPAAGTKLWARKLLGVAADASPTEIRRAFRALALKTHPDHGGDPLAFMDAKRALDAALRPPKRSRSSTKR